MRWVLFDLVVGAALVWLIWSAGHERPDAGPTEIVPAMAPAIAEPATPTVTMPAANAAAEPADPPVAARLPGENGRRLNALARDMEDLFLRMRE